MLGHENGSERMFSTNIGAKITTTATQECIQGVTNCREAILVFKQLAETSIIYIISEQQAARVSTEIRK